MAQFNAHLRLLGIARNNAVEYRRQVAGALSKPYRRGETEEMQERFVTLQKLIEAIDRAALDEDLIEQLAGPIGAGQTGEQKAARDSPAEPLDSSSLSQELEDLMLSWSTGGCAASSARMSKSLSDTRLPRRRGADDELKQNLKEFRRGAAGHRADLQHEQESTTAAQVVPVVMLGPGPEGEATR